MPRQRKGFSLVLSLTIMALMVLVVLAVASFLNLESRLAANRSELTKAQLNALVSARLAVGHLQMLAGPDQRVTAKADLFEGNLATAVPYGTGPTNSTYVQLPTATPTVPFRKRNWTGVWCTGGADSSKPRDWTPLQPDEKIFLGWLVSPQARLAGDATLSDPGQQSFVLPDRTLAADGDTSGPTRKGRWLINDTSKSGSLASPMPTSVRLIPLLDQGTLSYAGRPAYAAGSDPDKVELPAAPLPYQDAAGNKRSLGNYAWWVGDCGVKAKVNLADPATLTINNREFAGLTDFGRSFRTQAGRTAVEMMGTGAVASRPFGGLPTWWDTDVAAATSAAESRLQRSTSRLMLRNFANKVGGAAADAAMADALARHFHDTTHVSLGVLSDTLNGGLRRDLSVAFELPFKDYAALTEFNDSPGDSGDINGAGANWTSGFNLVSTMGINATNTPSLAEWGDSTRKLGFVYELTIPKPLYQGRAANQNNPVLNGSMPIVRGPTWDLLRNYYRLYKREYEALTPDKRRGQLAASSDAWLARGAEPFSYAIGDTSSLKTNYKGQPGFWAFHANASLMARKNARGDAPYYPENASITLPNMSSYSGIERIGNKGPIPLHTSMKLAPNVVRTAFIFSVVWTGTSAADAKLGIAIDMRCTLHNPYNVPLELNGMGLTVGKWYCVNFVFRRSDTLAQIGAMVLQPTQTIGRGFTFRIFNNGGTLDNPTTNIRLEPGEVRTFCASTLTTSATGEVVYNDTLGYQEIKNVPGVFSYGSTGQSLVYRFPTPPDPATLGGARAVRVSAGCGYNANGDGADTSGSYLFEVGQLDYHLAHNNLDNGTSVLAGQRTWYGFDNNPEVDMGDEHLVHRIHFLPRALGTTVATSQDIPFNSPVNTAFAMVDVRARAWDDSGFANQRPDTASPLFVSHRAQLLDYRNQDGDANAPAGWTLDFSQVNQIVTNYEMTGGRNNGFWGKSSSSAGGGQTSVVLYQVPTRPLLSLAGMGSVDYTHVDTQPGLTIGNSYCPPGLADPSKLLEWPRISSGIVNGTTAGLTANWQYIRQPRYDATWASNHALYDRYFFSGAFANEASSYGAVPAIDASQPADLATVFSTLQTGANPLANKRIVWIPSPGNTLAAFKNPATTAKAMLHDGTFNVNSTSREAWKAFLAGLRGQKLPGATKAATDLSPLTRFDRVTADHDSSNPSARFKALSDAEIETLAEKIVAQVRMRGPFMSLSDFVNRRLIAESSPGNGSQLKGALQAAIDATDINSGSGDFSGTWTPNATRHPQAKALSAASPPSDGTAQSALGASGMLLQSDILNAAGSSLSARSDTFVIRAYGEAVDAAGRPGVGAWVELTVQRMPEMVVPEDNEPNVTDPAYRNLAANVDAASGSSATNSLYMEKFKPNTAVKRANRLLGRRFRVVSFRWLSPNEI